MEALARRQVVALVSDAGTPMVNDPGYRLVREAVEAGVAVHPIPGPSSVLAALTLAGLPTDRFLFAGFPPPKRAARKTFLEGLRPVRATLVLFETGPRLRESLQDMAEVLGPRPAAVARELTKLYEECVRGPLPELAADPRLDAPKGEIVVVIGPGEDEAASPEDADAALMAALERSGPAEAASEVARELGLSRRDLYRRALELKGRA
jgi:16S rRNA (cytidine1402-2'-O)-methyltransferase